MKKLYLTGLLLAGLAWGVHAEVARGTKVEIDGSTSVTPGTWIKEEPTNKFRHAQFRLPKAKGDKEDAELIIFKGFGGSAKDNIERWKAQFVPPKGKTVDDISKVEEIKIGDKTASLLDISGTYKFNPQPFNPRSKTVDRPHYRMLAIHFEGNDIYHIKLTGPEKTIEQHQKGFDEWIKGFKK